MELWVGLACLKADPAFKNFKRFGTGKGAYVNIIAQADSRTHFEERVRLIVPTLDCILLELENVEPLESRLDKEDYPEEFLNMKDTAAKDFDNVVFGTFHIWKQDDAN